MQFEDFARAHVDDLLRLGMVVTGRQGDAEDFAQEALERIFVKWKSVESVENQWAYARRIAINQFLNRQRKRRVTESPLGDAVPSVISTDQPDLDYVTDELRQLPERQRVALVLRYYEDLDIVEIATELGIGQGSVRSSMARGLARLRLRLESQSNGSTGGK